MKGFRNRVLGPLALPLGVVAAIVLVVFNISRILLALEERESASTATALAVALTTVALGGGAMVAFKIQSRDQGLMILSGAVVILVFAGGFGWGLSRGEGESAEAHGAGSEGEVAAAPAGGTLDVVAKDPFEFEPKELTVPAGKVTVNLTNEGAIIHTFMLEGVDSFEKIVASGTRRTAPGTGTAATAAATLTPGQYIFFCDERGHRGAGMEGTLTVTEGGGGAAAGAAPAAAKEVDMVATDPFEFVPKEVTVAAGKVTVNLKNEGAIVHTFMFEGVDGFEKMVVSGTRRMAPGKETTATAATTLTPGQYIFFCDERGHRGAGMEGTLTVTEGGGGAAAGAAPAAAKEVDMVATDPFEFVPKEVTVAAGKVTVNLKNEGAIVHTFMFEGVDGFEKMVVSGTRRTAPGKETTATAATTLTPGQYIFFCDERGHRGAGMEGTLTVT